MKKTVALFLFGLSLLAQTAQYPGAIATTQQLGVVANGVSGTLNNSLTTSSTSLNVTNGSCNLAGQMTTCNLAFKVNMFITVQNEIMQVCSIGSATGVTVLNFGTVGTSCPSLSGRGLDGTQIAAHVAPSFPSTLKVTNNITAWPHNADAAEIIAIETNVLPQAMIGLSTTADNTAVYTANFARLSAGGGTLMIPPGTWKGSIVFPQYPKSIHIICSGQGTTTLIPYTQNIPLFSYPNIVANFVSGRNEVEQCNFQSHASGSTGALIDLRGSDFAYFHDNTFTIPAQNQTYGVLCEDTLTNKAACYDNRFDRILLHNQYVPTSAFIKVQSTASGNHFDHITAIGNTGSGTNVILDLSPGGPNNTASWFHCEGNTTSVCMYPGVGNEHPSGYYENNLHSIVGNGGSGNRFPSSTFSGNQIGAHVVCPNQESNFSFDNPDTSGAVDIFSDLASTDCANWGGIRGSIQHNNNGGITTTSLLPPVIYTYSLIKNQSTGLAAGDYYYRFTSRTVSGGESLPGGIIHVVVAGPDAPAQVFFVANPVNGADQYGIYGRNCDPTCNLIYYVPAVTSNNVGLSPPDNGSVAATGPAVPTVNTSGNANIFGDTIVAGTSNQCTDTGASDNNLACTLPTTGAGAISTYPWKAGFTVNMILAHTLVAGTNTPLFVLNGTSKQVVSSSTGAGTPLKSTVLTGSPVSMTWNGTVWMINQGPSMFQSFACTAGQHIKSIEVSYANVWTPVCD